MSGSGWKQVVIRHPYSIVGFCLAILIFIITATITIRSFGESTIPERQLFFMSISLCTVLAALGFGLVFVFDKVQRDAMEVVMQRLQHPPPDIEVILDPNEIWRQSNALLSILVHEEKAQSKHAYDVTTYMNKILYEENVVNVLNAGVRFDRIFCFDVESDKPSDQAVKWFYNRIFEGGEVRRDEIRDFESEIAKVFNGGEHVKEEDFQRLVAVINKQHVARMQGRLRISHHPYPQHTDFVVIRYTPQGSQSEIHEVVANFKTDPMGLTYTIGIHGVKRVAIEYKNMFENTLFKPSS